MESWKLREIELTPHEPLILASTDEGRAIAIALRAGEALRDHQVHERAWVTVVSGEVEMEDAAREVSVAGEGTLFAFAPGERHEVRARTDARLLLLLTPWPGEGHPGAMSLDAKRDARATARLRAS